MIGDFPGGSKNHIFLCLSPQPGNLKQPVVKVASPDRKNLREHFWIWRNLKDPVVLLTSFP